MTLRKFFLLYSVLLMSVLVGTLLTYRALVSIPKVKSNVLAYQQREMSTVFLSISNQLEFLQTINYDYAVWNESYAFLNDVDPQFIEDNFIPDTFISLKIDGVLYVNLQGAAVWQMGFDWQEETEIDFAIQPQVNAQLLQQLLKVNITSNDYLVPQVSGFLYTKAGPVLYSATLLRHSNKSGPDIGFLLFIRKLRPGVIAHVSKLAGVKISSYGQTQTQTLGREDLMRSPKVTDIKQVRHYFVGDINGNTVLNLDVEHSLYEELKLIDSQTLSIIALLAIIPISLQLLVNFSLLRPLTHSINTVGQMLEKGQLKTLKNSAMIREINVLNEELNQLIETITEQKNIMENLSLLDGLTNIANRRYFEKHFATTWQAMLRNNEPLAVLMCDLDYFKPYNDNYGHQAGDDALIAVAQALNKRIARPHELVARYGGEEFVIILPATNYVQCQQVIEAIQHVIAELNIRHDFSAVSNLITMSIGAATIERADESLRNCNADDFLRLADQALYQAKREGRNRYIIQGFSAKEQT
jgi:diguanylate cyclase (GGDEF)-like protein